MAVRVTLLIKKLDTLTYEEFFSYWEGRHAEIFLGIPIVKEKLVKFSQFHVNKVFTETFSQQGLPVSDYDGEVNLWFETMEDVMAMWQDPEYQRLVVPDGKIFSKTEESRIMIGYDKEFVADKKIF